MANSEQIEILKKGVDSWNEWREVNPDVDVDLSDAYFYEADFSEANFSEANLSSADLSGANLSKANLSKADLYGTNFSNAILWGADFSGAHLSKANLFSAILVSSNFSGANLFGASLPFANLYDTNLTEADLSWADLTYASIVGAILHKTNMSNCNIYGISAWDLNLEDSKQSNLIITPPNQPTITVDNIEVAQFIYLLLNNENVSHIIDTITSKVVLILGRFSEERKKVLDAIREELRQRDFTPVLFDFDKPASKDITGTIETLSRMAHFIIADLTDPSSIPHELASIVPHLRTTPVLPIRLLGSKGYSMFEDLQISYQWVLATYDYNDEQSLIEVLPEVIEPADEMAEKFRNLQS